MSDFYPPVDTDCPECDGALRIEIEQVEGDRWRFKVAHTVPQCRWIVLMTQSPMGGAEIAKRLGLHALDGLWKDKEH